MKAEDGIHMRVFQTSVIDHALRAADALFRRLKQKFYRTGKSFAYGLKIGTGTQQNRSMNIMTASVD